MSLNNEYLTSILVNQHQHDLLAEAAQQHLARVARGNRPPWWRRLAGLTGSSAHRGRRQRVAPAWTSAGR